MLLQTAVSEISKSNSSHWDSDILDSSSLIFFLPPELLFQFGRTANHLPPFCPSLSPSPHIHTHTHTHTRMHTHIHFLLLIMSVLLVLLPSLSTRSATLPICQLLTFSICFPQVHCLYPQICMLPTIYFSCSNLRHSGVAGENHVSICMKW